jgi:hypothetical protein
LCLPLSTLGSHPPECTKDESSSDASEHDESSYGHEQEILRRGYACVCLEGFVANLAAPDHDSCMATASPTLEPTAYTGEFHHIAAKTLTMEGGGSGYSIGDMTSTCQNGKCIKNIVNSST